MTPSNKKKNLQIIALVVLAAFISLPVLSVRLPEPQTEQQQLLEQKAAAEETIKTAEDIRPADSSAAGLPEDTTPRFTIRRIVFSGNTLLTDKQILAAIPAVYAADGQTLYDLRPLQALAAHPGTEQTVSARSIQGFTQYILSVYQKKQYAGIYVYIPAAAFASGGQLSEGILPIEIIEAAVSSVSSAYYNPSNQPAQKRHLSEERLLGWSPVKEGGALSRKQLDDYLNLLNLNPDRYVAALVSKGAQTNSLAVKYNVYEANPWHYFIQLDNSGTKDIQWRPRIGVINTSLLGYDDKFTAVYQTTPDSTWDDEYAVYGSYDFPLMGPRLRLNLFAGYNEFSITDPDTNFLGAGKFAGGILRYNALQFNDWFFDITGTLSYEESRITPEFFPEFFETDIRMVLWGCGADLYKTTDTADTFLGVSMLSPLDTSELQEIRTARTNAVDNFHIYYVSGRHSRYLDSGKIQRVSASLRYITSDDRLVPAKMTSFGGMYTVRGYDEYEIVADGGIIGSFQYEYDLVRKSQVELFGQEVNEKSRKPFLKKLAPLGFFDYGQARIKDAVSAAAETTDQELASLGCGLIAELGSHFTGTVYYGYPLIPTDDTRSGKGRVHVGLLLRW
ncbi:MAG TPA: ShlB/FhaC/HecB family hemolysin secretion/activation protein [Anaerohalosphaeraceae bacterium]|nr:ShlB/FhaC/HecB family hemolysin secretion/activation protein [Phycisphaerae bacterium]HOL31918.1 ShlB/FhaC/HecB family hemolysin secretion/activation protein [Anaerohalosphaeraceae bacterium]HPO70231.1 ShlB/FhaC/HecB family hemolysin secretion/activation protein [Anaerohalosphaeraceae bacterium]